VLLKLAIPRGSHDRTEELGPIARGLRIAFRAMIQALGDMAHSRLW
jgi:hypothetical protein